MCMKYLNTTVCCYKSISEENGKIVSLNGPFNSINSINEGKKIYIEDFFIITQFNLLGTNKENEKDLSAVESKKNINIIIRLTKIAKDENDRLGYDVDAFQLDVSKMQIDTACFSYANFTRITRINKLSLPKEKGRYVIKVLAKFKEEAEYAIQSMYALYVN